MKRRNRRGIACVELALILPLFVLLFLGMLDYSRWIRYTGIATTIARETAREGDLQPGIDSANASGLTPTQYTIVIDDTGPKFSATVSIPVKGFYLKATAVGSATFADINLRK